PFWLKAAGHCWARGGRRAAGGPRAARAGRAQHMPHFEHSSSMRDVGNQWQWHEAHRDEKKNMYRTSYSDMSQGREVAVKSDCPSGYGGHVPSLRFDVLHRNTGFDRTNTIRKNDFGRDTLPDFSEQLSGIPSYTAFPQGANSKPTAGVVPHDGTTTMLKPPWAVVGADGKRKLNQRSVPPTMLRGSMSSPSLKNAGMNLAM
ncbi:unnamed protein product, partial [Prorocentrum cordatum]